MQVMYKDLDKQREANRERQRRYKAKQKALLNEGVTEGITFVTAEGKSVIFTEGEDDPGIDGSIDIKTLAEVDAGCDDKLSHGLKRGKNIKAITENSVLLSKQIGKIYTGKPGDADYNGVCTPDWRAERGK